jgi:hypothetical protein
MSTISTKDGVPVNDSAKKFAKLIKGSHEIYYTGIPALRTA